MRSENIEIEKKRMALIGCGRWGKNILRDLIDLGTDVTVVDINPERMSYALANGAEQAVIAVKELGEVDGVIIATPTSVHAEIVFAVCERGIPIFVEKPITPDAKTAKKILDVCRAPLFIMDKWRYHAGIEQLAEIASKQKYGKVFGLKTERLQWASPHKDVDSVWILAPHDVAIALHILQAIPKPVAAVSERHNGKIVGLKAILGKDPWFSMEVSSRSGIRSRRIELHCAEALVVLEGADKNYVQVFTGETTGPEKIPEPEIISFTEIQPLHEELKRFVGFVNGGKAPYSDARDAYNSVVCVETLRKLAGIESK